MNAVTSSSAAHRPAGLGIHPTAVRGAFRRRGRGLRQMGTFAAIGIVSTVAYVGPYALLRPFMPAAGANAVALVATALGNTAANRRFTFAVRGRAGIARDQLAGLVALVATLGITSVSRAALEVVVPGAPHAIEVVILVAANGAATLVRFVVLRIALDGRRPRALRTAVLGPVPPARPPERTVR